MTQSAGTISHISTNNFAMYIYIYHFHQIILKEKTTIYKTCNSFDSGQACFLTTYHLPRLGNQVFAYSC